MPALFAYLIAVGLLLGGGYGALSWLAAPEPVKVAATAKSKPPSPPHHADNSEPRETTPPEPSKPVIDDKTGSNDKTDSVDQFPSEAAAQDTKPASSGQTKPASSGQTQDQTSRSAHAEMTPAGANQDAKQPAEASSPGNQQAVSSIAPAAAAKTAKRPHLRQASSRSEKRGLALMTLRTIEFPDGRRVSQLIPYGRGERASVFEPDQ